MNNLEAFEALKKEKKTNDTVIKLLNLLSDSKKENDGVLALKILLYIAEVYRFLRLHDETIDLLEQEINQAFFHLKEDRLKIIDELVRTLLRTEDFVKLKSVLFNRERYLTNEHHKIMQKFYYAVCYEGLKENKLAIEYLLETKDNISSSNLVSKYLKLSMLYLKEKNIDKAKEYYAVAVKFDAKKMNPIFYLAASDIYYAEKDYLKALNSYQAYFIKSKNKRRYLDRYILINIALDKLDEAWRFYQEYLPVIKTLVSKNYRDVFYQAALVLAKKLGNDSEYEKLTYYIEALSPSKPLMNEFDNVYQLLSLTSKKRQYVEERDIIFEMFRAIESLYKFQKLLYIKKNDLGVTFYHFSKGLLLEKTPKITEYSDTLIQDLLQKELHNHLYIYDDLITYSKSVYKTVETQYLFVHGIKRDASFDYFVVYSKDQDRFNFQQKLALIAHQQLKKQMLDFDREKVLSNQYKSIDLLLNQKRYGLIKIERNIIHFLNDQAKTLLHTELGYLSFEVFQDHLQKKVFLDDLLFVHELKVVYDDKLLKLTIQKDDLILYILIEEVAESALKKPNMNRFLELPNEVELLENLKHSEPKTVIEINIHNYLDFFRDYNYELYQTKIKDTISQIKNISRTHFDTIYLESYNIIYLTLKTTDKRVTKRIVDSILSINHDFDIRIALTQVNHNLAFNQLIKLRYLISLTDKDHPFIQDNKNFRYNIELAKTLLINIKSLIEKKVIPLTYQEIGDWKTNQIDLLKCTISDKAMLGERNSLKRILKSASLEKEWDLLFVHSLVKEIKDIRLNKRIILEVSLATICDESALKKLIKKLTSSKISLTHFVFEIDFSESINKEQLLLGLDMIREKNIATMFKHYLKRVTIDDLIIFRDVNYLMIDIFDTKLESFEPIFACLRKEGVINCLNHHNETITKTILESLNIRYLIGSKYKKYDSVNTALDH